MNDDRELDLDWDKMGKSWKDMPRRRKVAVIVAAVIAGVEKFCDGVKNQDVQVEGPVD